MCESEFSICTLLSNERNSINDSWARIGFPFYVDVFRCYVQCEKIKRYDEIPSLLRFVMKSRYFFLLVRFVIVVPTNTHIHTPLNVFELWFLSVCFCIWLYFHVETWFHWSKQWEKMCAIQHTVMKWHEMSKISTEFKINDGLCNSVKGTLQPKMSFSAKNSKIFFY